MAAATAAAVGGCKGTVRVQLEPTESQAKKWIEEETQRRYEELMGNPKVADKMLAATSIQCGWRKCVARRKFKERLEVFNRSIREAKASQIQEAWKNHVGRKQLTRLGEQYRNQMVEQAAVIMQQRIRGGVLARMHFAVTKDEAEREHDVAIMIQAWVRGWLARRKTVQLRTEYLAAVKAKAIVIIQSWFRGLKARKRVKRLQAGKYADAQLQEQAALYVQCAWRQHRARRVQRDLRQLIATQNQAAVTVQRHIRGVQGRDKLFKWMRELAIARKSVFAAVKLQALARGQRSRKQFRSILRKKKRKRVKERRRVSATKIQSHIRSRLAQIHWNNARSEERGSSMRRFESSRRGVAVVGGCALRGWRTFGRGRRS